MSSTTASPAHPLLIIGIDGATFDLVGPWVEAGYLPTLARLMREGCYGPLRVWPNMNSAAAWTSMVTGYNPGHHGIFDFGQPRPWTDLHWRATTAASRRKDAMWKRLSDAGDRVGVVNVPISFPAEQLNGFMIAGMDAPSTRSRGFCHPPELADELRRAGIDYILDLPDLQVLSRRDPARGARLATKMVDLRARTIEYLMTSRPWDMLMGVFVVTDRVQHHYWPAADEPLDGPAWAPVRDIYVRIDTLIDQLISHAGESCNVIVVSDHGFGPIRLAPRGLNRVLTGAGLVEFDRGDKDWLGRLLSNALELGRRSIPQGWQRSLARGLPRLHNRAVYASKLAGIDWSRTAAYSLVHGRTVYLRGGESDSPDRAQAREYERNRNQVISLLESLLDPATRKPLIKRIDAREELYSGPFAPHAGDLTIEWDLDVCRDSILYSTDGRERIVTVDRISGPGAHWRADHRPEGILIACGPDIRKDSRVKATIYDIAPTVLYLRGQPIPADFEGALIEELIAPEQLRTHPVRIDDSDQGPDDGSSGGELSEQDQKLIEDRLRGLGYIE